MENIETCPNGHNYDANVYDKCPYCPSFDEPSGFDETSVNASFAIDRTALNTDFGSSEQDTIGGESSKTQIVSPGGGQTSSFGEQTIPSKGFQEEKGGGSAMGTRIISPEQNAGENEKNSGRKVIGFLISYDQDSAGKSYKVLEGKNLIGASSSCDITISNDSGVSGTHMTLLYRNGVVKFRDEFSTNGTYVDGEMKEEGVLPEKCLVKVGNTKLIFIAIPFELLK